MIEGNTTMHRHAGYRTTIEGTKTMKTLSYYIDVNRLAQPLAQIKMRGDSEGFYVCNRYEDVAAAIATGAPFEAHKIAGMQPVPVTINPAYLSTAERVNDPHETFTAIESIVRVA